MDPDKITAVKRSAGFWIAGTTALFLSCISWVNRFVVAFFNIHLFHAGDLDAPGWWLYIALRIAVAGFLLHTVLRFPIAAGMPDMGVEGSKDTRFFDPLMGLRALACVLVLMGHYFRVVFPFTTGGVNHRLTMLLMSPPWAGVWVFFTLSGFLMGKGFARARYTLDEAGTRLFLRNRMLRIVPIYFCSVILVSIYRYPEIFQWKNLWMLVEVCIFDFRGDLPINPNQALWSVSTEVQFYLLVPLLMIVLLHIRRRLGSAFILFPLALIAIETALRLWIGRGTNLALYTYGYTPLIPNLDLFIAGMSMNLLPPIKNLPEALRRPLGPILLASGLGFYVAICYVVYYSGRFHMEAFLPKAPVLCVLFACAFIYVAEMRGKVRIGRGWVGRFLLGLQGVGTLTYCLYVFHPDIFMANSRLLPEVHDLRLSLVHFPLVVLETFAVAAFAYVGVEKPFESRKRVSGSALVDAP